MAASVDQLGNALLSSGLLTADEIKSLWSEIPAANRPTDGAAFAQQLIACGKLTPFQAQELLAGRGARLVMGDYVIAEEIGSGGMGRVYKARHRRMQRIVALKVMSDAAMKDDASVKRFQREVQAAARLEHPNIVTAYASGESGSVKYLVMQFVDGGDLSSLVKRSGPLAIELAVDFTLQTARGLAYAHGEGVIHRDIKPANLLLDKKGAVKILDMGLARIDNGEEGLTATEQVMGTVDYMSPEQAASTKNVDARADIYALGCTLWFLLSGKKLYEGDSMIARLMAHKDAPLPSLVKTRDDAPWPLEQALHKMVAKRADDRFQSMDEVIAALTPFGSGGGSSSGLGSSIGRGSGPQSAELAAFLQGAPLSAGMATKESPSKSKLSADAQRTSPDTGTDPQSRTLSARPAGRETPSSTRNLKPAPKKSSAKLVVGGAAAGVLLIAAAVWFAMRDERPAEVATNAVAVSATVSKAAPPAAHAAIAAAEAMLKQRSSVIDKLESPKYVWTAPENLGPKVNNGLHNRNPTLTADQLCLIVITDQNGQSDLVEFRRANVNERWGNPRYTADCNGEHAPALRADGLEIVYSSNIWKDPGYVGGYDIWSRRRATLDAPWGKPQHLGPAINLIGDDSGPALSPDGLTLAFHSTRPGGEGSADLYLCRRTSLTAPFGPPVSLGRGINTSASEYYPRFIPGTDDLLFERNGELMVTFRNGTGVVGAVPLPTQDARYNAPWLASDGTTLYFQRENWPGGRGGLDVWVTRRVPRDSPEAKQSPQPFEAEPLPPIKAVTFNGHSYQWVPDQLTWYDAQTLAEAMGGHLVAVNSAAEDDWLKQTLLAAIPAERMVWIGGVKEADGVWRWTNDEPMDYQSWPPNEGIDAAVSAAGIARRVEGLNWADWAANSRAIAVSGPLLGQSRNVGFVVEWDSPTPTSDKLAAVKTYDGHRYLIVPELLNWNAAKAKAESLGGHLLTIESVAERDWVTQRLWPRASRIETNGRFFFGGLARSKNEPWQWVTGKPMDMPLWPGAGPDDNADSLRVVTWFGPNLWDDVPPDWKPLPFIVEWDDLGGAAAPSPPQPSATRR